MDPAVSGKGSVYMAWNLYSHTWSQSLTRGHTSEHTLCTNDPQPACIVYMAISHECGRGKGVILNPKCACVAEPTTSHTAPTNAPILNQDITKCPQYPVNCQSTTESTLLCAANSLGGEAQHQWPGFWRAPCEHTEPCLSV